MYIDFTLQNENLSSNSNTIEETTQLTKKESVIETTSAQYVEGNPYFPVPESEEKAYKGIFTYEYNNNERDITIKYKLLGKSQYGTLYHLSFNRIKGEKIPKEVRNLGYFFIKKDRIYRMKELSDSEKNILIRMGTLPKDATIVCQNKAMKKDLGPDPNDSEVIWHEKIERKGNRRRYCRYWTGIPFINAENMIWEKGYGLIFYKQGYGADLDTTIIWNSDRMKNPHDFW